MELELEVSESQDYSEFPAYDFDEVRLCSKCKRKATTSAVYVSVKREDKATQTVSRKVWRKQKKQKEAKLSQAKPS